jgi:hypothetical protein
MLEFTLPQWTAGLPDAGLDASDRAKWPQRALSRWENEGGAGTPGLQESSRLDDRRPGTRPLTNSELLHLRGRVIALENLIVTLLAQAATPQLDLAREMAVYISPRPGSIQHPLTVRAAAQMIHLVERASCWRDAPPC